MKTTCPNCHHSGSFGFNSTVGGILHIYGCPAPCKGFWLDPGSGEFLTLADAWKHLKATNPRYGKPGPWRDAYDARIIDGNERKFDYLMKAWKGEDCRCNHCQACKAYKRYQKSVVLT